MPKFKIFMILAFIVQFVSHFAQAETSWVSFQAGSDTVKALIAFPQGDGPHPAVIYNHGGVVREKGYRSATSHGYDVTGYVEAIAEAGYIGLAPIREHLASADYEAAINGGVITVEAAIGFLQNHSKADPSRIGAIGFSEGGLVTLWSAIEGAGLKAIVLMSPATIRDAGKRQLKAAARGPNLQHIKMPVLLTVGTDDNRSIRKVTEGRLIPNMKKLGTPFFHKSDYPGDHKWFWKVQKSHFSDVSEFLAEHMR
jgi:dienelactone hydrolase